MRIFADTHFVYSIILISLLKLNVLPTVLLFIGYLDTKKGCCALLEDYKPTQNCVGAKTSHFS